MVEGIGVIGVGSLQKPQQTSQRAFDNQRTQPNRRTIPDPLPRRAPNSAAKL